MANWCKTEYTFTGDRESLEGIYALMNKLEETEVPDDESDFGTSWLGRLVTALDGDWQTIKCRGYWEDLCLNDESLTFSTWTAWTPAYQVIELLKLKFPGTEYFYFGEEPGNGFYETNDKEGQFYPIRYVAFYYDYEDEQEFRSKDATYVIDSINRITRHNFNNIEETNDYFASLQEQGKDDKYAHINEVSVIETNEALTLYFDETGKGRLVRPDGTAVAELRIKNLELSHCEALWKN